MELVFDIGGTFTKYALFNKDKLVKKGKYKTLNNSGLLDFLEEIIKQNMLEFKIKKFKAIGISAPAPLDSKKLLLSSPVNLPRVKNLNFGRLKKYCKKIILEEDANCAAVASYKIYKEKNIVCLTLGTGVGCGIIINKKLYKGKGGTSQFGHTTIDMNGKKANCNNIGCIEEFISKRGLEKIARRYNIYKNSFELKKMADAKNKKALEIYEQYAEYLSFAIVNIANTLSPDIIVLTGGLTRASKYFIKSARKHSEKRYFKGIKPKLKVVQKNLPIIGIHELLKKKL